MRQALIVFLVVCTLWSVSGNLVAAIYHNFFCAWQPWKYLLGTTNFGEPGNGLFWTAFGLLQLAVALAAIRLSQTTRG